MNISCEIIAHQQKIKKEKREKLLKICRENGVCTEKELIKALDYKGDNPPSVLITNDSSGKSIVNITYNVERIIKTPKDTYFSKKQIELSEQNINEMYKICKENGKCTEEELTWALDNSNPHIPCFYLDTDSLGKKYLRIIYPFKNGKREILNRIYNCVICGKNIPYKKENLNPWVCKTCKCPECGKESSSISYDQYSKRMQCTCGWKFSVDPH